MAPDNMHGMMHVARETMLCASFPDMPTACLRPTLVYGAGDPHNGYGPNRFRRLAQAGEAITLFGEGEERRDHVSVDDVAELGAQMVMHRSSGALNAATGTVISFMDSAKKMAGLSTANIEIITTERQGKMPHGGYRPFDPAGALPGLLVSANSAEALSNVRALWGGAITAIGISVAIAAITCDINNARPAVLFSFMLVVARITGMVIDGMFDRAILFTVVPVIIFLLLLAAHKLLDKAEAAGHAKS